MVRRLLLALCLAAVPAAGAVSQSKSRVSIGTASAPRGAIGEIVFDYAGPALCAKADQPETAPMLVRLARLEEPAATPDAARYRLSFLGSVTGEYDLLPLIEHCDGRPVTDLEAIRVQVFTQLPERHGTDLFTEERPLPSIAGHYRILVGAVLAAWILVPVAVLLRRWLRRPPPPVPVVVEPPPTLADQLRPLVEAAFDRGLSIAEQGRLELLLMRFWNTRLGLETLEPAAAITRLRREPEAGRLLVAVEEWLHAAPSATPRPKPDLAALLAPYRSVAAIEEPGHDGGRDALGSPHTATLAEARR